MTETLFGAVAPAAVTFTARVCTASPPFKTVRGAGPDSIPVRQNAPVPAAFTPYWASASAKPAG